MQLCIGGYERAEEHAEDMAEVSDLAERHAASDRIVASSCLHTCRTKGAERLFQNLLSLPLNDWSLTKVVMCVRYDLAELDHRAGRIDYALEQFRKCRSVTPSNENLVMIRVDMLEGRSCIRQDDMRRRRRCIFARTKRRNALGPCHSDPE